MRLVLLASGEFAVPTIRWLAESEHDVALVLTQPPRPSGRGRRLTATPVEQAAKELGLPALGVEDVNAADVVQRIAGLGARVGLVIAFGQMLGDDVLRATSGGCINLHASLLPKYRGAAPINWAIANGEERTGCTIFQIVRRMDAGPILLSRWTSIKPEETAGALHDRLAAIGVDAVREALVLFEHDEQPTGTPQDPHEVTLAPKLVKRSGFVRFDRPVLSIVNHVHGMTPWPGASASYHSQDGRWEKVLLTRVRRADAPVAPDPSIHPAGAIDERLYVAAADGWLEVLELKPSSGREMTWPDYVNGRRVKKGDRLATPE